jgi:preprotein translocase subunit YajC
MMLHSLTTLLAMGTPPGDKQSQAPFWVQLFPLILLFVLMYFILIRPQQKKAKEHQKLMEAIKPGDKIVTTGGIVATVIAVKEGTLSVRSADTKMEIIKSSVAQVTERSESSTTSNS